MSAPALLYPEWAAPLLGAWLAACLGVAWARRVERRRRRRLGLAGAAGPGRDAALLLALACLGGALLGPRLGAAPAPRPDSGIDLVLLLDVSRSMDARDVPPSRLHRARRAAGELLARLGPGDRAALAVFASRGVLLAPLTPDRDALAELLDAVDTSLVQPAGSHLGAGVRAALAAFEPGAERPGVIFALSDGEDPEQRGDVGAAEARRAGVRVLAAALGSDAGAPLEADGVPLRDAQGRPVHTRRRPERLGRLAAATGGALFRADAWGAFDHAAAARALRGGAGAGAAAGAERGASALPLAAVAFALLLLEGLPGPRRRGRLRPRRAAVAAAALLAVAAGPAGAPPRADGGPDPRWLLERGAERLERGQRDAAQRAFLAAALLAADPGLAALAYHDLGVAALEAGDREAARDAFLDALALDPSRPETRFNLEWTLRALRAQPPPPEPAPRPDEGAAPERPPQPRSRAEAPRDERGAAPTLDAAQRRRWLARVPDDPSFALRAAARAAGRPGRAASGPAW